MNLVGMNTHTLCSGTALHIALQSYHGKIVSLLIYHGADVNASRGALGRTPLHTAAQWMFSACIELIHAGADCTAVDQDGSTPGDLTLQRADMLLEGMGVATAEEMGEDMKGFYRDLQELGMRMKNSVDVCQLCAIPDHKLLLVWDDATRGNVKMAEILGVVEFAWLKFISAAAKQARTGLLLSRRTLKHLPKPALVRVLQFLYDRPEIKRDGDLEIRKISPAPITATTTYARSEEYCVSCISETRVPMVLADVPGVCDYCSHLTIKTSRCSRCRAVQYCSLNCQKSHWKQGHKMQCKATDTDIEKKAASLDGDTGMRGQLLSVCSYRLALSITNPHGLETLEPTATPRSIELPAATTEAIAQRAQQLEQAADTQGGEGCDWLRGYCVFVRERTALVQAAIAGAVLEEMADALARLQGGTGRMY